jgi:hypothetical protein
MARYRRRDAVAAVVRDGERAMQEEFNEARVYVRKRSDPVAVDAARGATDAEVSGRPEVRLATVAFALRPFASRDSPETHESIAWIAGRIGVFFGHAPEVTIEREGSAVLSIDAGPFPLLSELEAFATAISIEAAHIGMDCTCTATSRDGSRFRMVEGEFVITE